MTKLREDKVGDGSGYDRSVPPTSLRLEPNVSQAGTDVRVQLRFFKLTEVALDRGSLTAKVWWRMKWQDTRLAWNESAYGGITQAEYAAVSYSDQESTEIWLPDITPYNGKFGLMDSFDPAVARVASSGNVQWSRPGNLEVLCRFTGMMMFPLEEDIECVVEIGGWYRSGGFQGVLPYVDGDGQPACAIEEAAEESSLYSYTEHEIAYLECETDVYQYDCCPNEPWPILKVRIHFKRALAFYTLGFIVPIVIFTTASFMVFLIGERSGERIGLGVTLMLVIEVTKYTVQAWLPKCGELLWMDLFIFVNTCFTAAALFWSVIVLALTYSELQDDKVSVSALFSGWRPFLDHLRSRGWLPRSPDKEGAEDPIQAAFAAKHKAATSLAPLANMAGFNLTPCGQLREQTGWLRVVPALGLRWVELEAGWSPPPGWKPLPVDDAALRKVARALGEAASCGVATLSMDRFERFGLIGKVCDKSFVEAKDERTGKVSLFRPVRLSNRLASSRFSSAAAVGDAASMELTVCSVDGPPALLEALGEPGAPAESHYVLLNLSPFSAITLNERERKVAGIAPAAESFAFAYPAMFALHGPGKTAKSKAEAITKKAAEAAARSAAAQGAAAGSSPPEASEGGTVRVSVDGQSTPPVMRQSADSPTGDGDGRPAPTAELVAACRFLLNGGFVYVDCDGDLCQPPLAISVPEPVEANEHESHRACSGHTEEAGVKSEFSSRAGERSPLDLRLNGPHVLSPWATLKLLQAGRFTPITIEGIQGLGARSFAWVLPNEMRLGLNPTKGTAAETGCEAGAFCYLDGDGAGAFMRLLPGNVPLVSLRVSFGGEEQHEELLHELPVTCRVHELKTDIARIVDSASDKLSLTHGGKAMMDEQTLLQSLFDLDSDRSSHSAIDQHLQQEVRISCSTRGGPAHVSLKQSLALFSDADNVRRGMGTTSDTRGLYYELLFYQSDADGNDYIPFEDVRQLLAFLRPAMPPSGREKLLMHCEAGASPDGKLNRAEFIDMCHEALGDLSVEALQQGLKDHSDSLKVKRERHSVKMGRIGTKLDRLALFAFPLLYVMAMLVVFTVKLEDNYSSKDGRDPPWSPTMVAYIPQATVTGTGVWLLPLAAVLIVSAFAAVAVTNVGRLHALKEERLKGLAKATEESMLSTDASCGVPRSARETSPARTPATSRGDSFFQTFKNARMAQHYALALRRRASGGARAGGLTKSPDRARGSKARRGGGASSSSGSRAVDLHKSIAAELTSSGGLFSSKGSDRV